MLEIKARAGVDYTFWWWAPTPLGSEAPAIIVRHPSGSASPVLTQVRADVAVTGIGTDRKTLTTAALGVTTQGLQGDRGGHAWLVLDNHGTWPVRVRTISAATTVVLADEVPITYVSGAGDILQWSLWTTTFTSAAVTGTVQARPVPFRITWTAVWGADMPTTSEAEEGLLYVVRQPFNSGLVDDTLLEIIPGLAQALPRRQTSWAPQIDRAERLLIRWLRRDLKDRSRREDDVSGPSFVEVHAYLTAFLVYQGLTAGGGDRADVRDHYLQAAKDLYAIIREAMPYLDTDQDGVVDSGEEDLRLGIGTAGVGSFFDGGDADFESDDFPVFKMLQKH